jgi:hypothetical protein
MICKACKGEIIQEKEVKCVTCAKIDIEEAYQKGHWDGEDSLDPVDILKEGIQDRWEAMLQDTRKRTIKEEYGHWKAAGYDDKIAWEKTEETMQRQMEEALL